MIAEPDIPNSKKPIIPDSDRESNKFACEWISAFAGMTNVGNECIDAVGNVVAVYNANSVQGGYEKYYFSQDAFGNELSVSPFLSYSPPGTTVTWSTARTAGITEHQTGKWIDPFTGLYFFHARMYDPVVGRFVGKDVSGSPGEDRYIYCYSSPSNLYDPDGFRPKIGRTDGDCKRALDATLDWIDKGARKCCFPCWKNGKFDEVKIEAFKGGCSNILPKPYGCTGDAYLEARGECIEGWTSFGGGLIWIHTRICNDPQAFTEVMIHELLHSCYPVRGKDIIRGCFGLGDKYERELFACIREQNDKNDGWPLF